MPSGLHLLTERARIRVAERFRALSEPIRLRILEHLFAGPSSVGEIHASVGGTQANVSRHLALLHEAGLLERSKEGTRAVYSIGDPDLRKICEIVCAGVAQEANRHATEMLRPALPRKRRPSRPEA